MTAQSYGSSTEHAGWRVHMERTSDLGKTWQKTDPLNDRNEFGAIQPAILVHPSGAIQILCRSRQGKITELVIRRWKNLERDEGYLAAESERRH